MIVLDLLSAAFGLLFGGVLGVLVALLFRSRVLYREIDGPERDASVEKVDETERRLERLSLKYELLTGEKPGKDRE